MRVGFIGLGKMGRPMALKLLQAGFALTVHSRSRPPVDELVQAGAQAATSPREVAQASEVVLTSLPNPTAVEEVYLGPAGLVAGAREGHIFLDTSTVSPATSRKVAQAAQAQGARFLDAPVSGGTAGAQAGTLTVMVGGDKAAFEEAMPVLKAIGQNIHHVGPVGQGSVVKLVNQLLVGINMAGVVEGMVLGVKAGADPEVVYEVLRTSFGGSAMLSRAVPLFLKRNFKPGTPVGLLGKDLGLIGELGQELGVRLLLGRLAEQIFGEAKALGLGEEDMAALVIPLEKLAGVQVGGLP